MSSDFFPFFILLLTAVLFSSLFSRMRVPWVVALITGGFIIGPHGLELFTPDTTIDFFASVGLVFLMFMAGLEARFSGTEGIKKNISIVTILNGLIPGIVGFGIGYYFGYSIPTSILLGIIFTSSSIALLIPSFQAAGIINSKFGKTIVGATIIVDAVSLVMLSIFLQMTSAEPNLLLVLFYPFLIILLLGVAWVVPKIRGTFPIYAQEHDLFERELRFILLILIGLVVIFEFVGLHAIIAGFFAGFILSQSVQGQITKAKLHAISYGIFIPLFFVVVGSNINLGVFYEARDTLIIASVVVVGSIASKFLSGWLGGRLSGFTNGASAYMGASTIPSLSTTLAVAFLGFGQGLLTQELLTSIVILSVVTSITSPILVSYLSKYIESEKTLLTGAEKELEKGIDANSESES